MTIRDAISQLDSLKHNTYGNDDKIAWLSRLDATIKEAIIDTHEGTDEITFTGYTPNTDLDTELLVPAPYDEIYLRWLEAQIDYANGEYGKFNNAIIMYNTAYDAYFNFYNRNHMPLSKGKRFIF